MNNIKGKSDKELNAISAAVQNELSRRQSKRFQDANFSKVGKYFKTRNNWSCPSKPSDHWWMYEKCTGMDAHGMLKTFQFQTDKYGHISIRSNVHAHHLQYAQPCSKAEFDRAFKKMQQKVKVPRP